MVLRKKNMRFCFRMLWYVTTTLSLFTWVASCSLELVLVASSHWIWRVFKAEEILLYNTEYKSIIVRCNGNWFSFLSLPQLHDGILFQVPCASALHSPDPCFPIQFTTPFSWILLSSCPQPSLGPPCLGFFCLLPGWILIRSNCATKKSGTLCPHWQWTASALSNFNC